MRHKVARLSELPERCGWRVTVGDRDLALFRRGERVFALDDVCPHRGGSLAHGDVRDGVVYCSLHAWPFHIPSGSCLEHEGVSVPTHRVTVEGDDVWVEL